MKTSELEYEFCAALQAMTPERQAQLRRDGIDVPVPIGFSRIVGENGRYHPYGEASKFAFILPVRTDFLHTPETIRGIEAVRAGYLVDLLAFRPEYPDRWALRWGGAEWLGSIPPQYCNPYPVRIWRSPVRWLQSGCDGLVMLSGDPLAIRRTLCGCNELLVTEDDEADLRRLIEQPSRCPRIVAEARHAG